MNEFGYIRVASAIPSLKVGDTEYNVENICNLINKAANENVDIIVFPELCITGYSCADLFHFNLKDKIDKALSHIQSNIQSTLHHSSTNIVAIVGGPRYEDDSLYNSAFIITKDDIDWIDKTYLPNYNEFYEKRWFKSGDNSKIFEFDNGIKFAVEICEDVWSPITPSTKLCLQGADIIFNLSASNDLIGKYDYLQNLLRMSSAKNICGYVYASAGYGESTQDLVFDGKGFIFENGRLLNSTERFTTDEKLIISDIDTQAIRHDRVTNVTFQDAKIEFEYYSINVKEIKGDRIDYNPVKIYRKFNPHPFYSDNEANNNKRFTEIFNIQVLGLMKRLSVTNTKPVIGVSGGSDSTLALLVCHEAIKRLHRSPSDVIAVTMPGFATSDRTFYNSTALAKNIGADLRVIDIKESCKAELKALNHPLDVQDVTFENVQARMRTSILMNLANKEGGIVIGTGDLSELALGWCTYNGDHMSMYAVNSSIPKTLVKKLIKWYSDSCDKNLRNTLLDVLATPVSPELTGSGAAGSNAQVTEDKIGPYELHDFFLYNLLRFGFTAEKLFWMANHTTFDVKYSYDELKKWLNVFIKRFFNNQFKRSCLPDGPKVGSITLSPRGDWRMPSDASFNLML